MDTPFMNGEEVELKTNIFSCILFYFYFLLFDFILLLFFFKLIMFISSQV